MQICTSIGILAAILGLATEGQAAVGVRLLMGLNDKSSTKWDGAISITGSSGRRAYRQDRTVAFRCDGAARRHGRGRCDPRRGFVDDVHAPGQGFRRGAGLRWCRTA